MKEPKDHPFVILSRALPMQVIGFMVVQVAAAVIVTVGGSVALGLFIDTRVTNTKPLFTLLLSLIGAILSVYYYLRVVLAMYTQRAQNDAEPLKVSAPVAWAIGLCAAGVIVTLIGIFPVWQIALDAARSLFLSGGA